MRTEELLESSQAALKIALARAEAAVSDAAEAAEEIKALQFVIDEQSLDLREMLRDRAAAEARADKLARQVAAVTKWIADAQQWERDHPIRVAMMRGSDYMVAVERVEAVLRAARGEGSGETDG